MLSTELQHLLEGNFHRTVMALGGYKRAGKMIGMSGKYFQEHYLVQIGGPKGAATIGAISGYAI